MAVCDRQIIGEVVKHFSEESVCKRERGFPQNSVFWLKIYRFFPSEHGDGIPDISHKRRKRRLWKFFQVRGIF